MGDLQGPGIGLASDVLTIVGHNLAVNDRCVFMDLTTGMPTGITEGTVYFVLTVSGDDITISTTQGGSTLNITAAGDFIAWKVTPINISVGVTPQLLNTTIIRNQ